MGAKSMCILGAGPGGYTAAIRAAQLGCEVTVVEPAGLGGVCLQSGCIPVKALLISASVLDTVNRAGEFGIKATGAGFDYGRIMERKSNIVSLNEKGIAGLFAKYHITLLRGRGRLAGPNTVEVTGPKGEVDRVTADCIIIATGSSSVVPQFITLDQYTVFDCEGALARLELPESIVVLGGGILGCEFASFYRSLGVRVTIVEMMDALMSHWDSALSRRLGSDFRRRGIDIRTGARLTGLETGNGEITAVLSTGDRISAECCLAALGRKPNIEGVGIEAAGIKLWDNKFRGIEVDEHLRTNVPGIYAIGDVTGIRMLAHVASTQGIAAAEHFMTGDHAPVRYDAVPDCYWAQPELASVGVTEQAASAQGLKVDISRFSYRAMGITHVLGEPDGFIKVISEQGSGRVLGIHICGHGAPDMVAEATVVVAKGLTVDGFEEVIHAHPTMGEVLKEGIMTVGGRQIHG